MLDKNNRPKLEIPLSSFEIVIQLVSILGIVVIFLTLLLSWTKIPGEIPTHFGASGSADGWGGKSSLLFLPILMLVLYAMLSVIERFPQAYNYLGEITEQNAEFQYRNARMMISSLKVEIIFLFGYIEWKTVQVALNKSAGLGMGFMPVYLIILFGTSGFYIFRMVRNR